MLKDAKDQLLRDFLSSDNPVVEHLQGLIEKELSTLLDVSTIDTGGDLSVERIGQETIARKHSHRVLHNIFTKMGFGLTDSLEQGRNKSFR